ncbi:hypothetical protein H6G00_12450 [Leptolyngbya sp. FACHB-541]|uniref:hypothetical protein n=1 Tax=Leptolyngbya sp. FACHB-541 TaxID=2692810 RepID=UPI001685BBFC|nr:hypothetical protein [Leptolyngbya sp. FACHB-541]MBD1997426.1 hypothetical protein [Leptolyngbya sp. FACHB-541]
MSFEIPTEPAPTEDSLESALPLIEEPKEESELDPFLISQTILKLTVPIAAHQDVPEEAPSEATSVPVASTQVLEAMQRLVNMIKDLRSPKSGESPDVPQTPEALAPYLVEEAYDVLEAIQKNYFELPQSDSIGLVEGGDRWQSYFLISDLAPWLLWCIARSSHEVMRLLEGIPAKAFKLGQGWRTGIIRLVATLDTKIPELSAYLDLTTFQVNQSLLPSDTMIQSDQYSACQQPTWLAGLLPDLTQHITATTPSISRFFAGAEVDALAPNHNWQSGLIQLQLGFEFIATDATVFADFAEASDAEAAALLPPNATEAASLSSDSSHLQIKFTHSDWLEKYSKTLLQQQLASTIQQLPTFRAAGEKNRNLSSQSLIPLIVKDACDLVDLLQTSPALSSHSLQQEVELTALTHQLLWSFSRGAYEVMQLMGGIRVNLLQPECPWETGTLRLLASLNSKTPEQDWQLDITTGQPPQPHIFPLARNVIVQSHQSHWCERPDALEQLETKLMQVLEQAAPDLLLFLEGTDIEVLSENQQGEPGAIQLNVGFEFVPDLNYSASR